MADVTVTYEDTEIATLSDTGTKTLKTAGKYCDDDIIIDFIKSGGGGWTLLATQSLGTVSTSSSTETTTGVSVTVNGVSEYDILLFITERPLTNLMHIASACCVWLFGRTTASVKTNAASMASGSVYNVNALMPEPGSSDIPLSSYARADTGIYPYGTATISNDAVTMEMYKAYNNIATRTINGSYTTYVYGITISDLFNF